ncbi:PHP domain-containing protein [Thermodesulfobacterium sp. TA1]|uniref:PHP domain-containing protein n=1 Tax=Thermodesulfobacterium sp. TA1 TaxID=2234087 RepID=UPI0012321B40|nr:PHP domain-containing protein [Thermodesulfobacterium sp. TA1]QER42439.1 PHP domain-containing protein [Thermodesulfobacterium sp. TA1]
MVDLHTHSTASDGTLSPKELVLLAKKEGLQALALTDHDTTQGLKEAYLTAKEVDLPFICGVEISVKIEGPGNFHLLGYFLDPEVPEIQATLEVLQQAREQRNQKMIEKLQQAGIDITLEELKTINQGELGRLHIAKLLIKKGIVQTFEEAFQKYLKKGALAYVPKSLLSPEEAITKIKQARGIPVLAHPFSLNLSYADLYNYLKFLKDLGLMGIEAYYTEHTKEFTQFLLETAQKLDLIVTGGSDFHGANKPDIKLGKGRNNLNVPFSCYENLKNLLEKQR